MLPVEPDDHGRIALADLEIPAARRLAGAGLPGCLGIDTTPEVKSRPQDGFTILGENKRQTVNFIDPGDRATGGRSYIVDLLTSESAKPFEGSKVSSLNPEFCG